jgi:hypothetical protein
MTEQPKKGWKKCQAPGCPEWFDPKTRPGLAVTCSAECSEKYDRAYRKERWGRIGEKQNTLYRKRHQPIVTVLPLGTIVRQKWSRPPNIKHCAFRFESGELCGKEFDSKRGATHCPEHRGKIGRQAYLKQYGIDNYETISARGKVRHAEKKRNTPSVMMTCKNPRCPYGENGQPKQWVRRIGKNDYCCKECRMAVWTLANREKMNAVSNARYHATHPNARHGTKGRKFTPEHRAKISESVKRAKSKKRG